MRGVNSLHSKIEKATKAECPLGNKTLHGTNTRGEDEDRSEDGMNPVRNRFCGEFSSGSRLCYRLRKHFDATIKVSRDASTGSWLKPVSAPASLQV